MSLFQQIHTQIKSAGNILTIGFLEREGGKMTSRCDASSSTRGNQSWTPACDRRAGPAVSVLAGMKERRLDTGCFRGFSWDHKSYFDRVLCQTSPTLITHFQQDHAPPPTPPPAQGTRDRVTRYSDLVFCLACSPLLRRNSTPKGRSVFPLEMQRAAKGRCRII